MKIEDAAVIVPAEVVAPVEPPMAEEMVMPELTPQMMAFLAAMNQQTLAAVAEMKKPDAETQKKQDDEKARRAANAKASASAAFQKEQQDRERQRYCSHSKPNGMTAFVAQVNSDGCYKAFCPLCFYISPAIRAEEWQRTTEGLNMHKMRGITIPMLEAMAEKSAPPIALRHVPIGMVADFS